MRCQLFFYIFLVRNIDVFKTYLLAHLLVMRNVFNGYNAHLFAVNGSSIIKLVCTDSTTFSLTWWNARTNLKIVPSALIDRF